MRSTANKLKIEDLVHGEYVHSPEGEPNYLVTPWEEEVLRVNLIATIVDDFIRDDGGYATVTLMMEREPSELKLGPRESAIWRNLR